MKNNIEILIPTLNEEGNIEKVVNELKFEGFNHITILGKNTWLRGLHFIVLSQRNTIRTKVTILWS